MKNNQGFSLLSVEVIEKAVAGDCDAIEAVLQRYNRYIKRLAKSDAGTEERLRAKLMIAVTKFRFDHYGNTCRYITR